MPFRRKNHLIFVIYWVLLAYIIAALIWWFIALSTQNEQMATLRLQEISKDKPLSARQITAVQDAKRRKTAQYIGEGSIFFILIIGGAIFVFRSVRKQLRLSQQQHDFMMALTHELKTPIAVARLNLETMQKHKLNDTQQQRLL